MSISWLQQPSPKVRARKKFEYYTQKAAWLEFKRDKEIKSYKFNPNSTSTKKLLDSIKRYQDSATYWYNKSK